MKKFYYLKTCNTCMRILNEIDLPEDFEMREIKTVPITATELDEMNALAENYEALFSKRARLYKEMNLKDENLTEDDFKKHILSHYTFLKRPVIIYDNSIFIGNSSKVIKNAKMTIHGK
ncbi:MAG: hypothetical protein KJO22_01615 [Bacteroidia bacterium]|nr:hypothetical protein [Bacteroidia bacterium]